MYIFAHCQYMHSAYRWSLRLLLTAGVCGQRIGGLCKKNELSLLVPAIKTSNARKNGSFAPIRLKISGNVLLNYNQVLTDF